MMDADALELVKENVQPLKQGRRAGQLGLALQAQTDSEVQRQLLKERYNYELLIRMYEGDDPLQPRCDYVAWIEQTYPKHGPETNLVPLLEDTIATFKDDPKYRQDERFIKLIIKYIETQMNRLEIYQLVFGQGIGTMCALFYKAWAEELDMEQDFKRANHVYQLGLANGAQPRELLEQAQMLFQLSVGRRMISGGAFEGGDDDDNAECSSSAALAGSSNVPSKIVNSNIAEDASSGRCVLGKLKRNVGSLRPTQGFAGTYQSKLPPKPNAALTVYKEPENPYASIDGLVCVPKVGETAHFPKSEVTHKENVLKAGTWNKGYSKKHHHHHNNPHAVVPSVAHTPSTPSFRIHVDEDCQGAVCEATPMRPVSNIPGALKTKRMDNFSCPMAVFEPLDPTVKPIYPKVKVYAGGREFQLEEIMAAEYNKRYYRKKREEELRAMGLPVSCLDTPEGKISTPQIARQQCTIQPYEPMTPIYMRQHSDLAPIEEERTSRGIKLSFDCEIGCRDRKLSPLPLVLETPKRECAESRLVCEQVEPLPLLLETPERPEDIVQLMGDLSCRTPTTSKNLKSVSPGLRTGDFSEVAARPSVFHEGYVRNPESVFLSEGIIKKKVSSANDCGEDIESAVQNGGNKFEIYCDDSTILSEKP